MATKKGLERVAQWTAAALDNPRAFLSDHRIAIAFTDLAEAEGFASEEAFLWWLTQEDSLLLNLNDYMGGDAVTERYAVNGGTLAVTIHCAFTPNGEETTDA